jgi:hypothetical protein
MIAEVDNLLKQSDPVCNLCHSLTDKSKSERVNPRRFGELTWFESARKRFAVFNEKESIAIASFLRLKSATDEFERKMIDQALRNYWLNRAGEKAG